MTDDADEEEVAGNEDASAEEHAGSCGDDVPDEVKQALEATFVEGYGADERRRELDVDGDDE